MARTTRLGAGVPDRPPWPPRSAFPFQLRFTGIGGTPIHYLDEDPGRRCCW